MCPQPEGYGENAHLRITCQQIGLRELEWDIYQNQSSTRGVRSGEKKKFPETVWEQLVFSHFLAELWVLWMHTSLKWTGIVFTSGNTSNISCFCRSHHLESTLNRCQYSTDSENHSIEGSGAFDVTFWRVTIRTLPYFELVKIWDHFYYTNAPHFYSKSGLRFAVARCIATFLLRVTIRTLPYWAQICSSSKHKIFLIVTRSKNVALHRATANLRPLLL